MFALAKYLLFGFATSFLFLCVAKTTLWLRHERVSHFHAILLFISGVYLTIVFAITLSPGSALFLPSLEHGINLLPFQVLATAFSNPLNFWGNIFLFMPLGILLVLLFHQCQSLRFTLFIGAGTSFAIELIQLFGVRSTDIDDIILNTLGSFCGYLIGKAILAVIPPLRKKIGVFKNANGILVKKRHDAASFVVLSTVILISVFITGYANANGLLKTPVIPTMSLQAHEPLPEVHQSPTTSVEVVANNAYLWEPRANSVWYEKESTALIAPASTAKMLTALTVMEYCDADDEVLVGNEVQRIAEGASRAWLYAGNKLTVRQLLNALLLPSGNDAAYALAVFGGRQISGDDTLSIDDALVVFMNAVNDKAAAIGALNSYFLSPDGYDTEGQYTTAKDLALIAWEFLKQDLLQEIAGSFRISDVCLSGQSVTYNNTNELLNPESPYYYKYATGLKTGSSNCAGNCLVSCAYIKNKLYICVVMGSTENGRWQDSITLYQSILE